MSSTITIRITQLTHTPLPEGEEWGIVERREAEFHLPDGTVERAIVPYTPDGEEDGGLLAWEDEQGSFRIQDEGGRPRTPLMQTLAAESDMLWQWVADVKEGEEAKVPLASLMPEELLGEE
ncbi:MAG: hypothetical protein ACXQS1_02640 [Methermicoccaceae archaeon]